MEPRIVKAGNRGPFTLDGTRTYLIGSKNAVVIDPGPDVEGHVRALVAVLKDAHQVSVLLTHHHGDHAGCVPLLAEQLRCSVFGPPSAGQQLLSHGDTVATDHGQLLVVGTPGHTRDHLSFFWARTGALFVGDVLLGRGATTWLGEYPGCIADYLQSLQTIEDLAPTSIFPGHGGAIRNPSEALHRFRTHRLERLEQLREVRNRAPEASLEELASLVYGRDLPSRLMKAVRSSIEVMLHHLEAEMGSP